MELLLVPVCLSLVHFETCWLLLLRWPILPRSWRELDLLRPAGCPAGGSPVGGVTWETSGKKWQEERPSWGLSRPNGRYVPCAPGHRGPRASVKLRQETQRTWDSWRLRRGCPLIYLCSEPTVTCRVPVTHARFWGCWWEDVKLCPR